MTQTETLKLALEASNGLKDIIRQVNELIAENKALKEALAQPDCCGEPDQCWEPCGKLGKSEEHVGVAQSQRIWVGLTNEECVEIAAQGYPRWLEFAQAIETKLKEKNT